MKAVNVLIPEDLRARADAYAAAKGQSFGWLVRLALLHYLNRYAK
jgi:predicted transcriptional regulator